MKFNLSNYNRKIAQVAAPVAPVAPVAAPVEIINQNEKTQLVTGIVTALVAKFNAGKIPFKNLMCAHFGEKAVPLCADWFPDAKIMGEQIMVAVGSSPASKLMELGSKIVLSQPAMAILQKLSNNPLPTDVASGIKDGFTRAIA